MFVDDLNVFFCQVEMFVDDFNVFVSDTPINNFVIFMLLRTNVKLDDLCDDGTCSCMIHVR
jgi:hypothetical protein